MFGHSLNPDYFINPPAFTYVVHALFALRWGTDPATRRRRVRGRSDGRVRARPRRVAPSSARSPCALTAIAGARLFDDRRVGVLAGALLAVAFLPVHYCHFALNDAPTLAPLAAAPGRRRRASTAPAARASTCWRALGLGVAIATKYTAGIVLVTVDRGGVRVAGRARPRAQPGARDRR